MKLGLEKLNQEQKQAITYGSGPVLIVAGAGTGKTTVITKRIAWLIEQGLAKPDEILAMTFTDKAAQEMEDRVDRMLNQGYTDLWISTFHSFCQRVLQENGLDIGLSTDFKLLDKTRAWLLVRENLKKFKLDYYQPLANPCKFIHALLDHFSRLKDQAIYPEDYLKYAQTLKGDDDETKRIKEIARAYQIYQQLLLQNNLLDFGDLINYCLKLFQKRPLILKTYQEKFKYILIDEFQDTNWAQYELVKLLAKPENNLTVTADDDQSIYKFRNASFGNIVLFRKDFPKAKKIVLTQNYRSGQDILDLSYNFIQVNNPNRLEHLEKIDKKLKAAKNIKVKIEHFHSKTLEQEAGGVVKKIIEILGENKASDFNDFAILVRANNHAQPFCRALERAGLPYQFVALKGLYGKPIILDIIAYFKLLDNYHESAAVYRALNLPFLKIPSQDIAKITQYSSKKTKAIFQSLLELHLIEGLSEQAITQINFLLTLIKKHTSLAKEKNVSEVFVAFLNDSGYLEYTTKIKDRQSIDFINQFYDKIKAFEAEALEANLRNFMQQMEMELESGDEGGLIFDINYGPNIIKIMTVHSAKGLEFEYVFLVNLVDRRFPSSQRKEAIAIPEKIVKDIVPQGDVHLQEERRLFYVAMTRAKKGLFFFSADDYGGSRKKKLSRFLLELNLPLTKTSRPRGFVGLNEENVQPRGLHKPGSPPASPQGESQGGKEQVVLPKHFSFTQLRAFATCPYQYRFAHILKVPVKSKPVFSYGRTMHNVLFNFVKKNIDKEMSLADLTKIYKQEWIDEWYETQEQKQKYYELGKKALEGFYKFFKKTKPEIFLINNQPALEQKFNLKINSETLIGKIDRIDKIGDNVNLIDYKTGKAKEKLTNQEKEQLLIYQIAAEQVLNLKPEKLTYYYLDEGRELSFLGSDKDKEKQKEKIIEQMEKIKNSDFQARPGWHCQFCDFKSICEFVQKQ